MQIHLLAVGSKMPGWVQQGYEEYARRMPPECRLNLLEIPLAKRGKSSAVEQLKQQESEKLLAAVPKNSQLWALDGGGKSWSTEQLADQLRDWLQGGQDIALMIGGPDGLATGCLQQAAGRWSLSPLTLPHPLVRIIVAEQLYRAMSILKHHPYHK
ncbi:MAG: 23S rRNA (pseudouridine(1915)-N(3))-methyltransferase RlmH [Thiohalophilus sp.]|uniref:23S rRNA (pseudouridine(1915)-N(3))-methyltransferase RlmH n=1 Tax=Thiohalophilus sp. TaxID=3028392 RepID=UPI0028706B25|nr:23S rRNA (pseudouridine(1915)-N(3))-methyltransferase RlmH [Thiohalophilus sp.]MDR9435945.1 23S rRNA (pseudouridine(1915)-N(3))-methyltransferase RlmH [Thiohalophilus sp.]